MGGRRLTVTELILHSSKNKKNRGEKKNPCHVTQPYLRSLAQRPQFTGRQQRTEKQRERSFSEWSLTDKSFIIKQQEKKEKKKKKEFASSQRSHGDPKAPKIKYAENKDVTFILSLLLRASFHKHLKIPLHT